MQSEPFQPLGFLPGDDFGGATDVSEDGSTVVGETNSGDGTTTTAFRWTEATGMVGLGTLPGTSETVANATNLDGTVIIGESYFSNPSTGNPSWHSFRWTAATGMINLGFSPGLNNTFAYDVSEDGSVIVGENYRNGAPYVPDQAFRWTASGGFVQLGSLPQTGGSYASGVDADGSVVVGSSFGAGEVFKWAAGTGMVDLGFTGYGVAVSGDGTVIVGALTNSINADQAFRWTAASGAVPLGQGTGDGQYFDVNDDGSVIVGQGLFQIPGDLNANRYEGWRWTADVGAQPIQDILIADGVDLTDWVLSSANAVSGDGTTIVGYGTDPTGHSQGWIAQIPTEAFAVLDLAGADHSLGSLVWGGTVTNSAINQSAALIVGSDGANSIFTGTISDGASTTSLTKVGHGTLTLESGSSFSGGTSIAQGGIELGVANALGTGQITFGAGVNAMLKIDGVDIPANTIEGFLLGDVIDLAGVPFDPHWTTDLNSGSLLHVVEGGSQYFLALDPVQSFAGKFFVIGPDGTGGSNITIETTRQDNGATHNYNFLTLDEPLAPASNWNYGGTIAEGINGFDQIVGTFGDAQSNLFGFLYDGTSYVTLNDPSAILGNTIARGINDSGVIVGFYNTGVPNGDGTFSVVAHGFLYSGGANGDFTTIDPAGATWDSEAQGINASGDIVGWYSDDEGRHGYTYLQGHYSTLDDPDGTDTFFTGINASGDIVGYYYDGSHYHGLLYSGGGFSTIDYPSVPSSTPDGTFLTGINDAGDIVGYAGENRPTAFVYDPRTGDFTNISDPSAASASTYATGIDTFGDIVGYFYDSAGGRHGFEAIEAVACYCRGTLIATEHGNVPVEVLAIGDRVVTASGTSRPIKWIGRRSYSGRFALGKKHLLPICLKTGSLDDNVPWRDLWISPHHAIYFDGILVEAKDLINGASIVQAERVDQVEYFHVELDTHDVIVAEGALSETFIDDNSRGMFHNAHEYYARFGDDEPRAPVRYCAPRLSDGYEVEEVRRRIAQRSGLLCATETEATALRGYVDLIDQERVAGWAQNPDHPEAPVCLDIYADGRLIGQTLANRYRKDLEIAKVGSGRHSFVFMLPEETAVERQKVQVRRSHDGTVLPFSQGPSCMASTTC